MVALFLQNPVHFDTAYLLIACFAVADIPVFHLTHILDEAYEGILASVEVNVSNANLLN